MDEVSSRDHGNVLEGEGGDGDARQRLNTPRWALQCQAFMVPESHLGKKEK